MITVFCQKMKKKWANLIELNQKTNQAHLNLQKILLKGFPEKKSMKKNAYHTIFINGNPMINIFFHRIHAWNCMISIFCMELYDKHFFLWRSTLEY